MPNYEAWTEEHAWHNPDPHPHPNHDPNPTLGILTMPNFEAWTEEHAWHKLKDFMKRPTQPTTTTMTTTTAATTTTATEGEGEDEGEGKGVGEGGNEGPKEEAEEGGGAGAGEGRGAMSSAAPWGRLWRYQYWECLRVPCHEVIHLIQHVQKQSMNVQVQARHYTALYNTKMFTLHFCTCTLK